MPRAPGVLSVRRMSDGMQCRLCVIRPSAPSSFAHVQRRDARRYASHRFGNVRRPRVIPLNRAHIRVCVNQPCEPRHSAEKSTVGLLAGPRLDLFSLSRNNSRMERPAGVQHAAGPAADAPSAAPEPAAEQRSDRRRHERPHPNAKPHMVKANIRPAAVATEPVPAIVRISPAFNPAPISSLDREITRRL